MLLRPMLRPSASPYRMPIDRFYVVLNPTAGRGAAARVRSLVARELGGVEHVVVETAARGEAADLAGAAARAGWPAVVAVGGDGTVHEVVNGLMHAADDGFAAALGIVPVGSGNDFARLAGVRPNPSEALRRIAAGAAHPVDVGTVNGRWFTNGVGIGLDARVAIEVDRRRRFRGLAMYLHALSKVLRVYRPPRMRVEIDGQPAGDGPMTLVTVGNGGRHGGGFWICPDARIDDGVLDVCMCDGLGTLGILRFLPQVLRGTHTGASCVRMRQAREIRVTSPDPLPVHADGEVVAEDAREVTIAIHPGRLALLR